MKSILEYDLQKKVNIKSKFRNSKKTQLVRINLREKIFSPFMEYIKRKDQKREEKRLIRKEGTEKIENMISALNKIIKITDPFKHIKKDMDILKNFSKKNFKELEEAMEDFEGKYYKYSMFLVTYADYLKNNLNYAKKYENLENSMNKLKEEILNLKRREKIIFINLEPILHAIVKLKKSVDEQISLLIRIFK